MTPTKIQPQKCTFCRYEPHVDTFHSGYGNPGMYFIICDRCNHSGPNRTTVKAAIDAWNRIQVKPVRGKK